MSLFEEIENRIKESDPNFFDLTDFVEECAILLDQACQSGQEYDPRVNEKAENACNAYGGVAQLFLNNGYHSAAEYLLTKAWNDFGIIQRDCRQRIYRAGIAFYLARMYQRLGDKGAATRWALYTQADDILGGHAYGGGAGKHILRTSLGMNEQALIELNKLAEKNVETVKKNLQDDWSRAQGFAEDVVANFVLSKPEYSYLFAAKSSITEYPLSKAYFLALLDEINEYSSKKTTKEKGDDLENLASYLFLLIPGWVPRRNLLDDDLTFETDIVVSNLNPAGNLTAELLGRHFLVECKNWEGRTVGVSAVGYFLYRMRLTHSQFGVIFTQDGISGSEKDEKAAHSLIKKAFHEDGSICIVLDKDDFDNLSSGQITLLPLILARIERVRFGKPK